MAVIETVSIEDVFPLVDEYGNDLASRDYTTKENKAYVKELANSMRAKGIPDEMPVLVRDGGIYRIKSGNTRIQAMRLLGTKAFPAVVEDESTEQAILETVIRTNTKKKYEDIEESRFVRQLALFGTDDYVAEVTGLEPEKVAKVRKGAKIADDYAEDMSLLRLMAIADFEGDEQAVELLKRCSEREFPTLEKELRQKAERRAAKAAIAGALTGAGIEIAESAPAGWRYVTRIGAADADLSELADCTAVECAYSMGYELYRERAQEDPEAAERKRRRDEMEALYAKAAASRESWLAENYSDLEKCAPLLEVEEDSPYAWKVNRTMEELGVVPPKTWADVIFSYLVKEGNICWYNGELSMDDCKDFTALTDAMEECGYEPCIEEQRLYQMAKDFLEGGNE